MSSSPVTGSVDSAEEAKPLENESMVSCKTPMAMASRSFHVRDKRVKFCVAYSPRNAMAALSSEGFSVLDSNTMMASNIRSGPIWFWRMDLMIMDSASRKV